MNRKVVIGVVLAGVVVFVMTRHAERGGVKTGIWAGKTSQGFPMELKVATVRGEHVVAEWRMRFDSRCEKSGRILRIGVRARGAVPIVDGKFARDVRFVGVWDRLNGEFSDGGEARGGFSSNWAALEGVDFRALDAEKCTIHDLEWTARPGRSRAADDGTLDVELVVDESGAVTARRPAPAGDER